MAYLQSFILQKISEVKENRFNGICIERYIECIDYTKEKAKMSYMLTLNQHQSLLHWLSECYQ